jgi:hypothetical protein
MKRNHFQKCFVILAVASTLIVSCKRNKEQITDTTSPAFHIAQSENLVIPDAVKLPDNLPGGNSRVLTFYAVGVQKYKAQEIPGSNPVAYQWVFVAPQADLYDASNKKVGTHSQGPTWQLSPADSMFGQAFNPPRTAHSADPGSIDWLLLMPKTGKVPTGAFAGVDYLQRIDTNGGQPPVTPPTSATETVDVPYTAIYRFSKRNE